MCLGPDDRGESSHGGRAADRGAFLALEGERPEDTPGQRTIRLRQGAVYETGVIVQRPFHGAGRSVMPEIQASGLVRGFPFLPGAHERVLENGEARGVSAGLVQEWLDESRLDLLGLDHDGSRDRLLQLRPAHARHQVEPFVDRLGETTKLRAVAQIVGAHREQYVDRDARTRRFQQQPYELGRVLGADEAAGRRVRSIDRCRVKAEQLLELIYNDQQALARGQPGLRGGVRQPHRTASQDGLEDLRAHLWLRGAVGRGEHVGLDQRRGESADRVVAGIGHGDPPARAGSAEKTAAERRHHAASHDR